jgi:GTP1/Obg family GTP-binding protein
MKRAECLHALTLMRKGMDGLRINKEEEVESKKIQEHKAKIKERIHAIVEENPTINYDDFL